jgi:hyaluronate lyase
VAADNATSKEDGWYVEYRPTLPRKGTYQVWMQWPAAGSHSSSVPVWLIHQGLASSVHINEKASGGQWNSLGSFIFDSGNADNNLVRVENANTTGRVVADAVKFDL